MSMSPSPFGEIEKVFVCGQTTRTTHEDLVGIQGAEQVRLVFTQNGVSTKKKAYGAVAESSDFRNERTVVPTLCPEPYLVVFGHTQREMLNQ